jgi:hypothetical protein
VAVHLARMVIEELPERRGVAGAYPGSLRKVHY